MMKTAVTGIGYEYNKLLHGQKTTSVLWNVPTIDSVGNSVRSTWLMLRVFSLTSVVCFALGSTRACVYSTQPPGRFLSSSFDPRLLPLTFVTVYSSNAISFKVTSSCNISSSCIRRCMCLVNSYNSKFVRTINIVILTVYRLFLWIVWWMHWFAIWK